MPTSKAMFAEFVGTFALTLVGGGAIVMTAAMPGGGGGLVAVALAHGVILAVMVTAAMHISGGQLNPAVSIALGATGKQPWSQAGAFVAAQCVGSIAAAYILSTTLADIGSADDAAVMAVDASKLGATLGGMGLGAGAVLVLEIIATFFLMWVIMGSAVDQKGTGKTAAVGGFAIGLTLGACILFFGPLTGASLNPARSLGPALAGGHWDMHWVYWVAPIIGACLAAFSYNALYGTDEAA